MRRGSLLAGAAANHVPCMRPCRYSSAVRTSRRMAPGVTFHVLTPSLVSAPLNRLQKPIVQPSLFVMALRPFFVTAKGRVSSGLQGQSDGPSDAAEREPPTSLSPRWLAYLQAGGTLPLLRPHSRQACAWHVRHDQGTDVSDGGGERRYGHVRGPANCRVSRMPAGGRASPSR